MSHKAGFVNIIGKPNVGKSTLMNALLGEKLSIITKKAQTTRHRIKGILNDDDFQIIFSDTPGIIKPAYKLQESMMSFVESAFTDADIFLFITEPGDKTYEESLLHKLTVAKKPVIVVINKIDLTTQDALEVAVSYWENKIIHAAIIPISALHKANIEMLLKTILTLLPESPPYFSKDQLTDKSLRFFVSEIIREKILCQFRKEIPYSVEVIIDRFKEELDPVEIDAIIYVMRDTQKGILLGHKGDAIKKLGIAARKDIETYIGKHIYLNLTVKVIKNWREDDQQLKRFGYQQ
ncbi:MAG: GTPase Era [Bacteroidales bacterium]|nr:GTPase Era [Bacteroidales bacterium]